MDALIAELNRRFGYQTLRKGSDLPTTHDTLATGIKDLDTLLGGGLLTGATHSISGRPTSGATSLTYQLVAGVQAHNMPVIYLDMAQRFDPPNAAFFGVVVDQLLLASPHPLKHLLFLIQTIANHRIPCLVVVDMPETLPLEQLKPRLRKASVTLLVLTHDPLTHLQVGLHCQHQAWHKAHGDITHFTTNVHLERHPSMPPRTTTLTFAIPKEDERG